MIKHFCDSCGEQIEAVFIAEGICIKKGGLVRLSVTSDVGETEQPELCRPCVIRILTDDKHPMRQ